MNNFPDTLQKEITVSLDSKNLIKLLDKNINQLEGLIDDICACEKAMDEIVNQNNKQIQEGLQAIKQQQTENPEMLILDNDPLSVSLQKKIFTQNKTTADFEEMVDLKITYFNHQADNLNSLISVMLSDCAPEQISIKTHYIKALKDLEKRLEDLGF